MESRNKNHIIALDIAYEIMIRSYEPLILTVLHPGGEQYNCLALLSSAGRCFSPKLLINLSGSSIYERNSKIRPYPELYKKNKEDLLDRIAHEFELRLWKTPVRDCTSVSFLKKILELDSVTVLPAWYDGSYCSGLEEDAKSFPYYPLK